MNKVIARTGLTILGVAFLALGTFSCKKKGQTIAKVRVVDTAGVAFPNATVRLYPDPTIDEHGAITIDDTLITGVDGVATFDYTDRFNLGQAGVFVLDIEVYSGDTLASSGIINVKEETTTEETVVLQ